MVWVKVCGVRRRSDVDAAAESGADAIGLVLADSPRRITVEQAAELVRGADGLLTYLVTVDATAAELLDLAAFSGATGVQPHGAHAAAASSAAVRAGLSVLRPAPVTGPIDLSNIPADQMPLLDTGRPGLHGGTGETFGWELAEDVERDFVLAGGLGPDNVARAVSRLHPWGVDASSRLESEPGVKDPALIKRYVEEARRG